MPSSPTTLEILKAARELISEPERWTQRAAARNRLGNAVLAIDETAACWCASGAVFKAAGRFNYKGYETARRKLTIAASGDLARFNDTSTHSEVLRVFDAAIAHREAAK